MGVPDIYIYINTEVISWIIGYPINSKSLHLMVWQRILN